MYTQHLLFSIFLLLVAGQGLFLALALLIAKKGNWKANRYLGLFTLVVAIAIMDASFDSGSDDGGVFLLRTLIWPRDYLYGPALYFYARQMTLPGKYPVSAGQWWHFAPALIHMMFFWTLPLANAPLHKAILVEDAAAVEAVSGMAESIVNVEILTSILHIALYLFLTMRMLNAHRDRIKSAFSYVEKISLNWLRSLLFGVIAVYLIWILEELFSNLVNLSGIFDFLLSASMVALLYTMSILGLRQPAIFTGQAVSVVLTEQDQDSPPEKTKYKTSPLSIDLSLQLVGELKQLMSRDKPYLDSGLSLPQLAAQMEVSVNYLSQIVNQHLGQNFFEFVNGYRVREAESILREPERRAENILTIALEVGFNSKSSFYTAFKKHTGMTPGEYRKRV